MFFALLLTTWCHTSLSSNIVNMATASPDQLDINSLVSQLQAAQHCSTIAHSDTKTLLHAARNLVTALEKPENRLVAIAKGPVAHAALRVALKIKLFETFDAESATAEELAQRCGIDPVLMVRIMRALVCIGIFDENGEESYVHNLLSRPLMHQAARAMIRGMAETTDIMPKLPDYLASLDYRSPNDRHNSLFGFAHQTDLNMYEWLQAHPEQKAIFNDFQSANARLNKGSVQRILESLIVSDESLGTSDGESGQSDDRVLFVDVGGGRGESLRKFRRNHPELRGRLVIEDLPKVFGGQEVEEGVEAIAHDFFTPQPVKGKRLSSLELPEQIFLSHVPFHTWLWNLVPLNSLSVTQPPY